MIDSLVKMFCVRHGVTGKHDIMLTLTGLTVLVCAIKFLFDGASFELFGHVFNLGHTDASSFGTFLSPVLGAHGAKEWKLAQDKTPNFTSAVKPDNPDEEDNT